MSQTTPNGRRPAQLDIFSDAICPWCYIGKQHLDAALKLTAKRGLRFDVQWHPFQLNPDMPPEGVERAAYRAAKFGSLERSQELDAQVAQAAQQAGITIRHDLMTRTPNTLQAHRLIWFAGRAGRQNAVVDALFRAYFTEGRDIGDPEILADEAAGCGLDRAAAAAFLAGDEGRAEVLGEDRAARGAGLQGVPTFALERHVLFSGAVPADVMAEALEKAHRVLFGPARAA
jgi:predicted DsbA family dithiol-disulfide isomerase